MIKDQKRNNVDVGLDAIFGDKTTLTNEDKLKEHSNFEKNYYNIVHGTITFEDSSSNMVDFNEFNLPIKFISIFSMGKKH